MLGCKVMKLLLLIGGVLLVAVASCLLLAWPFMLIWNYAVVAAVTMTKPIEYWVAFWLMLFLSLFIVGSKTSASKSS